MIRVELHSRHAGPVVADHPWVFAQAVAQVRGEPVAGEEVVVGAVAPSGRFLNLLHSWQSMFGIGFGEMMVIAVILLIAVGPRQLPSLMKTVGKGIRAVRKASGELRRTVGIEQLLADDDLRDPMRKTPPRYKLTPSDLEREAPPEGIDVPALRQKAEEAARVAATTAAHVPVEPSVEPVSEKS